MSFRDDGHAVLDLITQKTAVELGPAGKLWTTRATRNLTATLERLGVDRQLEEALTHGADPLHLVLVFGIDEILAACTRAEADYDVPDLLPPALDELGLTSNSVGSVAGQEAAARALAARMLAGELTPRELAFRIHRRFGHELPLAERLAELDDEYDLLEYGEGTPAQVDADVTAEALRLAQHPRRFPTEPTDTST